MFTLLTQSDVLITPSFWCYSLIHSLRVWLAMSMIWWLSSWLTWLAFYRIQVWNWNKTSLTCCVWLMTQRRFVNSNGRFNCALAISFARRLISAVMASIFSWPKSIISFRFNSLIHSSRIGFAVPISGVDLQWFYDLTIITTVNSIGFSFFLFFFFMLFTSQTL